MQVTLSLSLSLLLTVLCSLSVSVSVSLSFVCLIDSGRWIDIWRTRWDRELAVAATRSLIFWLSVTRPKGCSVSRVFAVQSVVYRFFERLSATVYSCAVTYFHIDSQLVSSAFPSLSLSLLSFLSFLFFFFRPVSFTVSNNMFTQILNELYLGSTVEQRYIIRFRSR